MKGQIEERQIERRTVELAEFIIEKRATVRTTAKHFGISKSTVHKDITQRLVTFNKDLYNSVREVLDDNKSIRHIRGGIATKEKYLKMREEPHKCG